MLCLQQPDCLRNYLVQKGDLICRHYGFIVWRNIPLKRQEAMLLDRRNQCRMNASGLVVKWVVELRPPRCDWQCIAVVEAGLQVTFLSSQSGSNPEIEPEHTSKKT